MTNGEPPRLGCTIRDRGSSLPTGAPCLPFLVGGAASLITTIGAPLLAPRTPSTWSNSDISRLRPQPLRLQHRCAYARPCSHRPQALRPFPAQVQAPERRPPVSEYRRRPDSGGNDRAAPQRPRIPSGQAAESTRTPSCADASF